MRKRISAGSASFANPGYFESDLWQSGRFKGSIVWVVLVVCCSLYITIRYWHIDQLLVCIFICGVVGLLAPWVDIIRDHRRIHAALREKLPPDQVAQEALKVAAGQAVAIENVVFFAAMILLALVALLRGGRFLVR